jgi:hypothetical protein
VQLADDLYTWQVVSSETNVKEANLKPIMPSGASDLLRDPD